MRIARDDDRALVVESAPGPAEALAAVAAVALALALAREALAGWPAPGRALALGGVLALVAAGVAATWVRTRVVLDRERRVVRWWRRSVRGVSGGEIAFADVRQVVLQTGPRPRGGLVRVALLTARRTVPVVAAYQLDGERPRALARRLREVLGVEAGADVEVRVRELLRAGRDDEARRMLREREGLDAEQASELLRFLRGRG